MAKSKLPIPPYSLKMPADLTNDDVVTFINDYKDWLASSPQNITFTSFCRSYNIHNPYAFKDYLMTNFTGMNNTIDFQSLWQEVEKMREDKLIELGLFDKDVNSNFLVNMMKSRFGWHDNTVVVGISMEDIIQAKKQALNGKK